jgi:hypothetical protein
MSPWKPENEETSFPVRPPGTGQISERAKHSKQEGFMARLESAVKNIRIVAEYSGVFPICRDNGAKDRSDGGKPFASGKRIFPDSRGLREADPPRGAIRPTSRFFVHGRKMAAVIHPRRKRPKNGRLQGAGVRRFELNEKRTKSSSGSNIAPG